MVSVMILRVWPVSGVHLSTPLDYAPQQGKHSPFQLNQIIIPIKDSNAHQQHL